MSRKEEYKEEYKEYWWGENAQFYPGQQSIIKLSTPRVLIRYELEDVLEANFKEFFDSIEEIHWLDGNDLEDTQKEAILKEAWDFLIIEEHLLEQDLLEMDDNDDDDDEE